MTQTDDAGDRQRQDGEDTKLRRDQAGDRSASALRGIDGPGATAVAVVAVMGLRRHLHRPPSMQMM
jgi:hypothetical protein